MRTIILIVLLLCISQARAGDDEDQWERDVAAGKISREAYEQQRIAEATGGGAVGPAFVPLGGVRQDQPRTWSDARGKTLRASLAKIEITIELKLAGGKTARVAWEKLSPADQRAVRDRIALLPLPGEPPRPATPAAANPTVRQVAPWTRDRTTDELRRDAVGQSKESLLLWLGSPKYTTDLSDEKHLIYEDIAKGRVTKVLFR